MTLPNLGVRKIESDSLYLPVGLHLLRNPSFRSLDLSFSSAIAWEV